MDRLRTLLWVGAMVMIIVLLALPAFNDGGPPERPTTDNTSELGVVAFQRWLATASIPTHAQRLRFTQESLADLSATTGNLAVLHVPAILPFEADEIAALMRWVSEGNTLLVASGHLESAPWVYDGFDLTRTLWRLTGLRLRRLMVSDDADEPAPPGDETNKTEDVTADDALADLRDSLGDALNIPGWLLVHGASDAMTLVGSPDGPFATDLDDVRVPWDGAHWVPATYGADDSTPEQASPADPLGLFDDDDDSQDGIEADIAACGRSPAEIVAMITLPRRLRGRNGCTTIPTPAASSWQTVLTHADSSQAAMLQAPLGDGEVLVLLHPSVLANDVIHRFDNRRFAMRLVDTWLGDDGTVIFDDAHQGVNDIVESADLVYDWRLYASIGFVLLFWVGYLLANNGDWARALYRSPPVGMGQLDLVRASAGFLDLRLRRDAVYEAILDPLRTQLARKWRLSQQDALTQGLIAERDKHPELVATVVDRLSALAAGRRVVYATLQHDVHALSEAIR